MNKSYLLGAVCAAVVSLITLSSHAALINNGGGLVYDDVLDVTWSQQHPDLLDWAEADTWAAGLRLGGIGGWRQPYISVEAGAGDASSAVDCSTATELACRDNEMGYMFYQNLGGTLGHSILNSGDEDLALFPTLNDGETWTGTTYGGGYFAWYFSTGVGTQFRDPIDGNKIVWSVREGNVVNTHLPVGARLTIGPNSFFELPDAAVGHIPLSEGEDGLVLGDIVPALPGSFHVGLLDGNFDELGGIVQSYEIFNSTGTFWTEFPIVHVGGGLADMSGWRAAWGEEPFVRFDNPNGFIGVNGNTYVLDYEGLVTEGPFAGMRFVLHLEGEVILPDTVLPDGTRLTVGSNSYFEIPDISPMPVPLAAGVDGLVLGDIAPALLGSFHIGLLDGNPGESGGIVQSYEYFGNTGTFWTEFPIVDLGGGLVDMTGWRVAWSDSPFLSFDNPTGTLIVAGTTYVLDYHGLVNEDVFIGLPFILHLEGEVILSVPPVDSDNDGIADDQDNCIDQPNGPLILDAGGNSQLDADGDGYGNICDADLNQDGITNGLDIGPFRTALGTTAPVADFNGDGIVNGLDIGPFRSELGTPPGPSCCGIPLP